MTSARMLVDTVKVHSYIRDENRVFFIIYNEKNLKGNSFSREGELSKIQQRVPLKCKYLSRNITTPVENSFITSINSLSNFYK